MRQITRSQQKLVRHMLCLFLLVGCIFVSLGYSRAASEDSTEPAWTSPVAMTIRQISQGYVDQDQTVVAPNVDCFLVRYRTVGSDTKQNGCFTSSAFGLVNDDNDLTIFNGGDEAIPILPYISHQVLMAWPKAGALLSLTPANPTGSYIGLYRSPLSTMPNQRNIVGQIVAKQLTRPPDFFLEDQNGQPLIINPETIAFSDGGSWMVVETLTGSFVRINLATLDETAFAPAFGMLGSPTLPQSRVAISDDGQYVAIENDEAATYKVYGLKNCEPVSPGTEVQRCPAYDYWSFVQRQVPRMQTIRHVRFVNHGLLSFETIADNGATDASYELAPSDSISSLTDYIGLGDSYTSGEGAYDYLPGTDTTNDVCHLSHNSYPFLLTSDLYNSTGGHSVACSGAVINDVGSTNDTYIGQVRGVLSFTKLQQTEPTFLKGIETNYTPGYIAQQRFVSLYQPRVITVSVGGDDIGFGDILQRCVEPHVSKHTSDDTCFNTYEDRLELENLINKTQTRLGSLYKQLSAKAPGSTLYVVGYPQIAVDNGNCALNVHLDKSELEFAEELIDRLNDAVQQAALDASANYVDIGKALAGHRLCEVASYDVAVNGLTAGTAGGPFGLKILGKESYHPNALGQQLIEQAILRQTHNLRLATAASPSTATDTSSKLLDAPKSGRTITAAAPDDNLTGSIISRGTSVSVTTDGERDGLEPEQTYVVRLDGSNGTVLGTLMSDADADLSGQVVLPIDTGPGGHTIDVTGESETGEQLDITQPIYVIDDGSDADGDGIADASDPCPTIINSGQDSDQDDIDDSCDPLIGPPTASGGPVQPNSESTTSTTNSAPTASDSNGPANTTGAITSPALLIDIVLPSITPGGSTLTIAGNLSTAVPVSVVGLGTIQAVSFESGFHLQGAPSATALKTGVISSQSGQPAHKMLPTSQPERRLPVPKVIRWLLWAELLMILLFLLLLLCFCINRWFEPMEDRRLLST